MAKGGTEMRQLTKIVLIMGLVWLVSAPARAQSDADRAAVKQVITEQIAAFRQDDAATAYSYAAPSIKMMFPSPDRFMEMVRTGYGAVYRPQSFDFGPLDKADGQLVQPVRLVGPDGQPMVALYVMEQQEDGAWKIAGVYMLKGSGETA